MTRPAELNPDVVRAMGFVPGQKLDELALLRESQIIGDPDRGIRGLFPVSRAEWRKGIREQRYPAPAARLGHMTFWAAKDIAQFLVSVTEPQERAE